MRLASLALEDVEDCASQSSNLPAIDGSASMVEIPSRRDVSFEMITCLV